MYIQPGWKVVNIRWADWVIEIKVIQPTHQVGLSKIVRFKVEISFVIQRACKVFKLRIWTTLSFWICISLYGLQVNEFIAESADNMLSFNKVIPS